jgi:uncharacterized membrane protein YphA (DoxX/SURF4 family)
MNPPVTASARSPWLALFRIYVGAFWLIHGVPKLLDPAFGHPGGMMAHSIAKASAGGSGPYHAFLTGVVLPHLSLFATLVSWGETLAGISLVLGLLTPVGATGGAFLALNYWAMKSSWTTLNGIVGIDMLAIVISFMNLVLMTGLVFGLDGLLRRRSAPVRADGRRSTRTVTTR